MVRPDLALHVLFEVPLDCVIDLRCGSGGNNLKGTAPLVPSWGVNPHAVVVWTSANSRATICLVVGGELLCVTHQRTGEC